MGKGKPSKNITVYVERTLVVKQMQTTEINNFIIEISLYKTTDILETLSYLF